jgi:hypothetical protein
MPSDPRGIRRDIKAAEHVAVDPATLLSDLDELQASADLTATSAPRWAREVQAERKTERGSRDAT